MSALHIALRGRTALGEWDHAIPNERGPRRGRAFGVRPPRSQRPVPSLCCLSAVESPQPRCRSQPSVYLECQGLLWGSIVCQLHVHVCCYDRKSPGLAPPLNDLRLLAGMAGLLCTAVEPHSWAAGPLQQLAGSLQSEAAAGRSPVRQLQP